MRRTGSVCFTSQILTRSTRMSPRIPRSPTSTSTHGPAMDELSTRRPRLAFLLLRGLDHFAQDLITSLPVIPAGMCGRSTSPVRRTWRLRWPGPIAPSLTPCGLSFAGRPSRRSSLGPRSAAAASSSACTGSRQWRRHMSRKRHGAGHDLIVVSTDMARRVRHVAPEVIVRRGCIAYTMVLIPAGFPRWRTGTRSASAGAG